MRVVVTLTLCWFGLAFLEKPSFAAETKVTVEGWASSGTDKTGVFGPPGDLSGKSFTVTFVFEDAQSENKPPTCMGTGKYQVCASMFSGDGSSSPVRTATIQIADGPVYAMLGQPRARVGREITQCCYQASFEVGNFTNYINVAAANPWPKPRRTSNPDWRASFADPHIALGSGSFGVLNLSTNARAEGYLHPTAICVGNGDCKACPSLPAMATLDVKLRPQQTPLWCWAASVEMIVKYFFPGASITQCSEANKAFGLKNCCYSPLGLPSQSTTNCVRVNWPELGNYGLDANAVDRPLTFAEIKEEIGCYQRPFAFIRNFGNHSHMMVGIGYVDLGLAQYVYYYNPLPTNEEHPIMSVSYEKFISETYWFPRYSTSKSYFRIQPR